MIHTLMKLLSDNATVIGMTEYGEALSEAFYQGCSNHPGKLLISGFVLGTAASYLHRPEDVCKQDESDQKKRI